MQDINVIRNIALFGQGKSGKTSLAEAILFTSGKTNRLGKVEDGSALMDFDPEEQLRKLSINSAFNRYTWKKHTVFITDTPGDDNFINEALFASRIADCGVLVIDASVGIKYQSEKITEFLTDRKMPAIIYINKLEKERADFNQTVNDIKENLHLRPAVICLPIGAEADFKGIVDLVGLKAFIFEAGSGKVKMIDIPAEMADEVAEAREGLMEQVAETDDELIEKFLEEGELSEEELLSGLTIGAASGAICPVCVGSATSNFGTEFLLDKINELMPSPIARGVVTGYDPKTDAPVQRQPLAEEPFSALVFKTMADPYAGRLTIFRIFSGTLTGDTFFNATKDTKERFGQLLVMEGKEQKPVEEAVAGMIVAVAKLKETVTGDTLCDEKAPIIYKGLEAIEPCMSYAVRPKKKDDEDKLFSSITKMLEEDPTLKLSRQPQTREILIAGVGQIHLQVVGEKIKRKFGVEMELLPPKVPYLETIKGKATVQGKHKKQSGGRGQFGDSWIEIEPMPRGGGFVFEDRIVGGVIPRQYIPAVEKGIIEAMEKGILAGYPMVDIKIGLIDGSYHNVDSSEMAFKISGSLAFKKGAQEANPVLLEPIMEMKIKVPKDCVGDIIGDLNGRRGKVMGMDSETKAEVITAQAPMAEILNYAADLTSITGARGSFSVAMSHYEELPSHLADKVIAASKEEQ